MNTREIKFRGKRIDNGEWVYGYYRKNIFYNRLTEKPEIIYEKHFIGCISNIELFDNLFEQVEIIHETLGEYTGLKDKGCKKDVYEFDVDERGLCIKWNNLHNCWAWFSKSGMQSEIISEIYDDKGEFTYRHISTKIIGNLFDNPELLK